MIALLAACALGSGCAAGTGATKQSSKPRSTESSEAQDTREARQQDTQAVVIKKPPPPPREQSASGTVVIQKPLPAKPVKDGPAPLVYLLPGEGMVRIVDKTAGIDIASTAAESRSIVRIDDLTGVQLGKQTLVRGPLPAGHEYEIYLTTGTANDVQRNVLAPVPTK
jgi:hypothetical protein